MHATLEDALKAVARPLEGLSVETAEAHPGGDVTAWNAREVVEHLLATFVTCSDSLEARLAKGRPLVSKRSAQDKLRQALVVELGRFPHGGKSPAAVLPGVVRLEPQDGAQLTEAVRHALMRLDDALTRVETVYPREVVVTHLMLGPLSVRQWRRFHRVHARHHAKQLARIALARTAA